MIIKQYKAEVESRTQGSRPRTQKKSETKVKDSPSEDRPSQDQGQECSRLRPRTKDTGGKRSPKKGLKNFFSGDLQKNGLQKHFSGNLQNFNDSKNSAAFEPRTVQFSRT